MLSRIRQLIPSSMDTHYDAIAAGFSDGRLEHRPMSDAELAAAIREVLQSQASDALPAFAQHMRDAKG